MTPVPRDVDLRRARTVGAAVEHDAAVVERLADGVDVVHRGVGGIQPRIPAHVSQTLPRLVDRLRERRAEQRRRLADAALVDEHEIARPVRGCQ
jgi:hypothetical protein